MNERALPREFAFRTVLHEKENKINVRPSTRAQFGPVIVPSPCLCLCNVPLSPSKSSPVLILWMAWCQVKINVSFGEQIGFHFPFSACAGPSLFSSLFSKPFLSIENKMRKTKPIEGEVDSRHQNSTIQVPETHHSPTCLLRHPQCSQMVDFFSVITNRQWFYKFSLCTSSLLCSVVSITPKSELQV